MRTRVGVGLLAICTACGPVSLQGPARTESPVDSSAILAEFEDTPPVEGAGSAGPSVRLTAPAAGSRVGERLHIEGEASDDRAVASVFVRVGPNQPLPAQSSDGFRSFSLDSAAPFGRFEISATARDDEGNTSSPFQIMLRREGGGDGRAAPHVAITSPAQGDAPLHLLALIEGTASDDQAVVAIDVTRNGDALTEREVETSDFFAHWSRLVPLLPGEDSELEFTARDADGNESRATLTLAGHAQSDRTPPELEVQSPAQDASVDGETLQVTGSAMDASGIREVKLRAGGTPTGSTDVMFGPYVRARTRDGFRSFDAELPIRPGAVMLEVVAIDLNGLSTRVRRTLTNGFVPMYADEVEVPLRLPSEDEPTWFDFSLDRQGIDEVFSEALQRDMRVLELETTALLTDSVDQIKESCGTRWREDDEDPRHDCSRAGYGRDRSPPIPWQETPEYSMVRLLTMTPANVVVRGTSLANLQGLADLLGIGGGFHSILADTLGIPATREIVSTASVVKALQSNWLQTHPSALPGAKLGISLYDAMHELMPLAERLGPSGDHPGLMDPAFPPRSQLLTDAFEMRLSATSNLRWLDGVDVAGADGGPRKDYLATVVDATGPSFDDVLEFDFADPARFDVRGLMERPRVDLRMLLRENPSYIRTCTGDGRSCRNNLPQTPLGGYVWSFPAFEIEPTVAKAAYEEYRNRRDFSNTYTLLLIPSATVTMGAGGAPAGWTTFETLVDLGDPPPPQYIWETISEVAQVALHNLGDTTLREGRVNVAFTLHDVNVGLSADGIRAAMRPALQRQRAELSRRLLGDYARNNGTVDFYYRRGADGAPYLFFVAKGDPRPEGRYAYAKPGFFADAELRTKVSTLEAGRSGDSEHEKLALEPGETVVFMRDAEDVLVRLRFVVGDDPREIAVFVAKRVRE